jgi:hypothetical protein
MVTPFLSFARILRFCFQFGRLMIYGATHICPGTFLALDFARMIALGFPSNEVCSVESD